MRCELDGLTVNYETFGAGQPLVVISGLPSDHRVILSWLEPVLASRVGWQRVYFDLPGTGLTPAGGLTTIDQLLDVVCDFIDHVCPGQRFTLLGLSVGGYLARGVVYRKSDRVDGLCLLVPWLREHDNDVLPPIQSIARDKAAMEQLTPEDAQMLEGLAVVQNQRVVDWYRNVVRAARQLGEGIIVEQVHYSFDINHPAQLFEKPALIVAGRQDSHVGYRDTFELLASYPRATLAILDRAGHALGIEQEHLFAALLNEWLDRVEEQKRAKA